uniref:Magnetosome protein Mad24 n=1 Tax=Candidatus Magnetananas rongchengensis TaxID=1463558 RepID=A0A3S6J6I4_9BACT|nr:magnetosome protein Mad24 [Candidatus Magnetananas rongchenensis]
MNTSENPKSISLTETEWIRKKNEMLKSSENDTLKMDKKSLINEKKQLIADIECLESTNHSMARQIKSLQFDLEKNRKRASVLFDKSDETKRDLEKHLAVERGLLSELEFYEAEKSKLSNRYIQVMGNLDTHMESLDNTVSYIDFVRGEIVAIRDKMDFLEDDVPDAYKQVDDIDDLIDQTVDSLTNLYDKAYHAEKNIKINYYKTKKGMVQQ